MKRWISLLLCLCMMAALCPSYAESDPSAEDAPAAEKTEHQIVEKTVPSYLDGEKATDETYYCVDGEDGILWVDLETWTPTFQSLLSRLGTDPGVQLTGEANGDAYILKRENNAIMGFDFEDSSIIFNDYDCFISKSYSASIMDALSLADTDEDGKPYVFQRQPDMSYDRPGGVKTFDLASYGIQLIHQDGKYLVPLSTIVDITLSQKDGISLIYNGQAVFLYVDGIFGTPDNLTPLGEIYSSAQPRDRTKAEAEYGYGELCMVLDNFYGLKDIHKISSFDTLFANLQIQDALKSPDSGLADTALAAVIHLFLADAHSSVTMLSWMTPKDNEHKVLRKERTITRISEFRSAFSTARQEYYPDGVPGYEEVGNTAFITFDSFSASLYTSKKIYDISEDQLKESMTTDNLALVSYAHRQITRENSPIENVVLDLSCNTGGAADAAIFVISWFLGEAEIAFQDQCTGALSAAVYKADINLDREFDEKDQLTGKNLYCLISPISFSCGNLVPAAFKSSQKVTLLGQQSGGGSCVVAHMVTTWGTMFQMSSSNDLSVFKNGSMYDIDQGIVPDYYLSKFSSFYDRAKLAEIINNMD